MLNQNSMMTVLVVIGGMTFPAITPVTVPIARPMTAPSSKPPSYGTLRATVLRIPRGPVASYVSGVHVPAPLLWWFIPRTSFRAHGLHHQTSCTQHVRDRRVGIPNRACLSEIGLFFRSSIHRKCPKTLNSLTLDSSIIICHRRTLDPTLRAALDPTRLEAV